MGYQGKTKQKRIRARHLSGDETGWRRGINRDDQSSMARSERVEAS